MSPGRFITKSALCNRVINPLRRGIDLYRYIYSEGSGAGIAGVVLAPLSLIGS